MAFPFDSKLPLVAWFAASVTLATFSGCASNPKPGARPPPQPVITGQTSYLSGQIQVVAELGPFRLVDALPANRLGGTPVAIDEEAQQNTRPRGGGGPGPSGGGNRMGPGGSGGGGRARQSLTVTLRNTGTEPIHLRVAEVRSALGNFAPVPEVFTLEPGQVQALEAMRSFYPASIDELELVVRLRTADADELQTLKLTL